MTVLNPKPPVLIGLTGLRRAGKSTVANILASRGYHKAHTFAPGLAMCSAYFAYVTGSEDEATRMVSGDLKDVPRADLPNNATPRYFMERFGNFMGNDMGPEWTLGQVLTRAEGQGHSHIIVESIVHEAELFRTGFGGKIIRITRPNSNGPIGIHTDAAQALIDPDYEIVNAGTLNELEFAVLQTIAEIESAN